MEKKVMPILKILGVIMILCLTISYVNHRLKTKSEEERFAPLGTQVEVNGHKLNVYVEGDGEKTLVFMAGGGTSSPILDFKSLYSLLSDNYTIVVVEKAGYGFSDDANVSRDIDTILSETRQALSLAEITGPFVLVPHSMSGIEALYWEQEYPTEVEAIIGLDMSVPKAYEEMTINRPLLTLISLASKIGITRFIPDVADGAAVKYGTLSDNEKELYRSIFHRHAVTTAMLNEVAEIKANAAIVKNAGTPDVPMLLFVSNGSGGTGFDKDTWQSFQEELIATNENGELLFLDVPHYVHNHAYKKISIEIEYFMQSLSE